ncbi:MAG: hypothetical protein AB7K24_18090 [Gemmataceae bacterium]
MSLLSADRAMELPAGKLAEHSAEELFQLKLDTAEVFAQIKALVDHVDRALDLKYAEAARQLRLRQGKDTGVVHLDDGTVRVTADLPKKVEWDQDKLADIVRRIRDAGDDPTEFVDVSYRVAETKFNAWPESLRRAFESARTVKTGKPGYRLALMTEV